MGVDSRHRHGKRPSGLGSALRTRNAREQVFPYESVRFATLQRRALISAVAFIALISGITGPAIGEPAQQDVVIPDEPSCHQCRLVLEPVVKFGAAKGQPGELCTNIISVAVHGDGNYYAAPTCTPGQVNVYRPDGVYSHSISVPKSSASPILRVWVSPTAELHVVDMKRRHHVFDRDGSWLTARQSPAPIQGMVFLPDGRTVEHFVTRTPEMVGLPLHLVSRQGSILASFGAAEDAIVAGSSMGQYRVISGWEDDSLLAAPFYEFVIEEWGLDGRLRRSLSIDRESALAGESRPAWTIGSMRRADDGKVWILTALHPDLPSPSHERVTRTTPEQIDELVDTRVDVVDIESGRLWASATTERPLLYWTNDLSYSLESLHDSDRVAVAVWRLGFTGSETEEGR